MCLTSVTGLAFVSRSAYPVELGLYSLAFGESWAMCWMWEHRADRKEAEGCCIERATASDYIHNQMSKQVTNTVT